MDLGFDGETVRSSHTCDVCGRDYVMVRSFVEDRDRPLAVVFAACHLHGGEPEIWIDAAMGSFAEPVFADQATFSCVVRASGATLVTGPVAAEGKANFFGTMLTPEQARSHPRIDDLWKLIDFVVTTEPTVANALYGPQAPV
jgi:hypothetical protein